MSHYINHRFILNTYNDYSQLLAKNSDIYYNCIFQLKQETGIIPTTQPADIPGKLYNATIEYSKDIGVVPISNGGTGAITQQTAIINLVGSVADGKFLRGNGTNVLMDKITLADLPANINAATANNLKISSIGLLQQIGADQTGILLPGTTGNVLRSDGSKWISQQVPLLPAVGTLGSIITSDGTNWISRAPYSVQTKRGEEYLGNGPFGDNDVLSRWRIISNPLTVVGKGYYLITYNTQIFSSNGNDQKIGVQLQNGDTEDNIIHWIDNYQTLQYQIAIDYSNIALTYTGSVIVYQYDTKSYNVAAAQFKTGYKIDAVTLKYTNMFAMYIGG